MGVGGDGADDLGMGGKDRAQQDIGALADGGLAPPRRHPPAASVSWTTKAVV